MLDFIVIEDTLVLKGKHIVVKDGTDNSKESC